MKRKKVVWKWEDVDAQEAFAEWVGFADLHKTSEQVDKIEALLHIRPPMRLLDLGCGTGRHALELARRGYQVVGIDVAQKYLDQAKAEAKQQQLEVEFRIQRGAELREENLYNLILAYNHTLGFMSDDERSEHFQRARAALIATGKLLLVLAGPRLYPGRQPSRSRDWAERAGRFILSEKYLDDQGYRNEYDIVIDTNTAEIIEFEERQKAFSLEDVVSTLVRAGFAKVNCFADLEGHPATPEEFGVFVCSL